MESHVSERELDQSEQPLNPEVKPKDEKKALLADISPREKISALEEISTVFPTYEEAKAYVEGDKASAEGLSLLAGAVMRDLVKSTDAGNYRAQLTARTEELKQSVDSGPNLLLEKEGKITSPEQFKQFVDQLAEAMNAEVNAAEYVNKGVLGKIRRLFAAFKLRTEHVSQLKAHQQALNEIAQITQKPGWEQSQEWQRPDVQSALYRLVDQYKVDKKAIQQTATVGTDFPIQADFSVSPGKLNEEDVLPRLDALQEVSEPTPAEPAEEQGDEIELDAEPTESEINQRISQYAVAYVELTQLNQQLTVAKEQALQEVFANDATLTDLRTQLQQDQFADYRIRETKIDPKAPIEIRHAFHLIVEKMKSREAALRKETIADPAYTTLKQRVEQTQDQLRELKESVPAGVIERAQTLAKEQNLTFVELCKKLQKGDPLQMLQAYERATRLKEQLKEQQAMSASWDRLQERGEYIIKVGQQRGFSAEEALAAIQSNLWPKEIKRRGPGRKIEKQVFGAEPRILWDREALQAEGEYKQAQLQKMSGELSPTYQQHFDILMQERAQLWNTAENMFAFTNNHPELFEDILDITAAYNRIKQIDIRLSQLFNRPEHAEIRGKKRLEQDAAARVLPLEIMPPRRVEQVQDIPLTDFLHTDEVSSIDRNEQAA